MTDAEFIKLQETQTEIMDEVHRICTENNIKYYMIGGTALGAIRHNGFIPWDFDIDIAMQREDYERFKVVCESQLNERYIYRDCYNTPNFDHPHALICVKNTVLKSKYAEFNPGSETLGIFLDVFPLDNSPDDEDMQARHAKRIKIIKTFIYYRTPFSFSGSKLKKFIRFLFRLLFFWVSIDKLNVLLQNEIQRYNNVETKFLCSMTSHYSYKKQCMPKEIYGDPVLHEFSGKEYFIPEDCHEYLRRIYGDYMKLPSVEQQKASKGHFAYVRFDS